MNLVFGQFRSPEPMTKKPIGLKLRETHSGYSLTEASQSAVRLERFLKGACVLILAGMGAHILLANLLLPTNTTRLNAVVLAGLFILVAATHLFAARGLRRSLKVNAEKNEFRCGTEDIHGRFVERGVYRFADVESIFMIREKRRNSTAKLHLRLKDRRDPVLVLSGSERILTLALQRLRDSVQFTQNRSAPRIRTTKRLIHMSFV